MSKLKNVCVFGFNVAFNNFSVISRRCLVATGSSMLTFIVLPHWSIMSQTLDMIPHPVTLSWHWVDQSQLYPVSLSAKRGAASNIFYDFGMSRPGIEPVTSRSPERTPSELLGPVKTEKSAVWLGKYYGLSSTEKTMICETHKPAYQNI